LLENVCRRNPEYKKTAFLFAAISAKHLENLEKAERICSVGLERYGNYKDLLMYRANINSLLHRYENAYQDFERVLKLDSKNVEVMIRCAECRCRMGAYLNGLTQLTEALHLDRGEHHQ
jgi:tetratricopeptide (TPR) repeat protein